MGQMFSNIAYDSRLLADNDDQLHTPDDTNARLQPIDDHTVPQVMHNCRIVEACTGYVSSQSNVKMNRDTDEPAGCTAVYQWRMDGRCCFVLMLLQAQVCSRPPLPTGTVATCASS